MEFRWGSCLPEWHGSRGHHDDPIDCPVSVDECKQAERVECDGGAVRQRFWACIHMLLWEGVIERVVGVHP